MTAYAEALLCAVLPERDPLAERAADLVAHITADPALRRVDELAGGGTVGAAGGVACPAQIMGKDANSSSERLGFKLIFFPLQAWPA